jgi:hypothetical protein
MSVHRSCTQMLNHRWALNMVRNNLYTEGFFVLAKIVIISMLHIYCMLILLDTWQEVRTLFLLYLLAMVITPPEAQ